MHHALVLRPAPSTEPQVEEVPPPSLLMPVGRVSLMGAYENLEIPNLFVTLCNITLKGNWMYERNNVLALIKMVEKGNLRLKEEDGCSVVGEFGLDQWREALTAANQLTGIGESVVFSF